MSLRHFLQIVIYLFKIFHRDISSTQSIEIIHYFCGKLRLIHGSPDFCTKRAAGRSKHLGTIHNGCCFDFGQSLCQFFLRERTKDSDLDQSDFLTCCMSDMLNSGFASASADCISCASCVSTKALMPSLSQMPM